MDTPQLTNEQFFTGQVVEQLQTLEVTSVLV
jgi:hypothetical protein